MPLPKLVSIAYFPAETTGDEDYVIKVSLDGDGPVLEINGTVIYPEGE